MGSNKYYKEDGTFDTDKFYDEVARIKAAGGDQNKIGTEANLHKLATEALSMNYDDFTKGNDYASLAKRYSQQGQKAMDDTIGKVATRTGGLASSYATAAGNQAYNDWMGNLEEAARYLYDSQKQEKMNAYSIAQGIYDRNVANEQWQKQFNATQEQNRIDNQYREDTKHQTLVQNEEDDLFAAIYNNANIYPTYAAYKEEYPNSLLTEADFKRIKSDATAQYTRDTAVEVEEETVGNLSALDKSIIDTYKWYVDNNREVPVEIQEQYNKIMGLPSIKVGEYTQKIADAQTYDEATTFYLELYKIDETAAYEALEAWEEQHPDLVPRDPNYYSGKASNAGYKYDVKQFS